MSMYNLPQGDVTPELLQRRRKIAEALMAQSENRPRYAVEGAGEGLKKVIGALMNRRADKMQQQARAQGIPGFRLGTDFAPGGMALVGEDGPEFVRLPRGSQVIPNPQTMLAYDDGNGSPGTGPASRLTIPQNGFSRPLPADDYLRQELGDQEFEMYRRMSPKQQLDYLNDPNNGFIPPAPVDGREDMLRETRFDDARSYQTADMSGIDVNQIAQQPAMGEDSTQARRLADNEVALRDAMNGLGGILEDLQSNPDLLDAAHTWTGRGRTGLLRLRDRTGIDALDISPEQEQELGDVTAYKQQLLTRVNQYIKDITGAQVGQGQETQRLMAVQANESDSPTQVIAKITNAMNLARLDIARRHYMQRTGGEAPSDLELRRILKDRGKELYDAAIAQGLSPNDARMQAASALSQEFGL